MADWAQVLGECSVVEIEYALESWKADFPPNVMQFHTSAKSNKRSEAHTIHHAVPKPDVPESIVDTELDKMHSLLTKGISHDSQDRQVMTADRDWFERHGMRNLDRDYDAALMAKRAKPQPEYEYD